MCLFIRDNLVVELFERRVKDGAQMLMEADEAVCCAQLSRRSVCWETVHHVMGSGYYTDDVLMHVVLHMVWRVSVVNVERRADSRLI